MFRIYVEAIRIEPLHDVAQLRPGVAKLGVDEDGRAEVFLGKFTGVVIAQQGSVLVFGSSGWTQATDATMVKS